MALGPRHPAVQRLRRLLGRRSERAAEGAFVVEGSTVLGEALSSGAAVEAVFAETGRLTPADAAVVERARASGVEVHELEAGVAARVGSATTPQPVLAVARALDVALEALPLDGLVLVCPELQDPGNLGTILRSAEAAGARGVVCPAGSVDPYNSKCVRASAGALFHIPVVVGVVTVRVLEHLRACDVRVFGTSSHEGDPLWDVDLTGPLAVVLGNEARGLGVDELDALDGSLTIPMSGVAESLNVGVAAAVVAFEAARQRRAA